MKPWMKITRFPYEEPYHLNLVLTASNGRQRGEANFYTTPSELADMAAALQRFGQHAADEYLYERGSERDRDAYYFKIRFFVGGIHLRYNNNRDIPEREMFEFCILMEVASLNRLGSLLSTFAQLRHELLYWDGMAGFLYENRADAELFLGIDLGDAEN